MAFNVPNFNLLCNVWQGLCPGNVLPGAAPGGAPDIAILPCQLYTWPKEGWVANPVDGAGPVPGPNYTMVILRIPKLTDIRDFCNAAGPDIVECPAGSNRWYIVRCVEDQHKGFPNEYRRLMMSKCFVWPTPIP